MGTRKLIPIGTKFGDLVIIERIDNNKGMTTYKCKCDCGNEHIVKGTLLRMGRRQYCTECNEARRASGKRKLIESGTRFGELVIIGRAENDARGRTMYKCQCDCGAQTIVLATALRVKKQKNCNNCAWGKEPIPSGTRFGGLVVIKRTRNYQGHVTYKCECDCGRETDATGTALKNGRRKYCGKCKSLVPGESGFNRIFKAYIRGAEKRGHVFELTKDEFKELVASNCAYCGIPPSTVSSPSKRGNFTYNGVDRVDNNLGYISDNVVSCCRWCNSAKGTRNYDEWIDWLDRIAEWRRK